MVLATFAKTKVPRPPEQDPTILNRADISNITVIQIRGGFLTLELLKH